MRLTLLVRADKTGLGYQTRDYYKFLKPHKTVIIDASPLNGNPQNYDWYENAHLIRGIPSAEQIDQILSDTDVLMTAETPYNLHLYAMARAQGVKTVCVENPEFYDHIKYPEYELPDLIILPSKWLESDIRKHAESKGAKVIQLHHPVDTSAFTPTPSSTRPFNISGKPAAHDRNGTWDFLRAFPDGTVMTQSSDLAHNIKRRYRNARVIENIDSPQSMYQGVLVLPRRYGGNCLPLNEALASGVPVIMPDIEPNRILPKEWLVPATVMDSFAPRFPIDIYSVNPADLHIAYDNIISDMGANRQKALEIAKSISWDTLKPQYIEALESL